MKVSDAVNLIGHALPTAGGTWADLGAGTGTFTRAIASILGTAGRVYAVDRDPAVSMLSSAERDGSTAEIIPVRADFTRGLTLAPLDGVLLANALHFVPASEQRDVLARIVALLRPGGRVVIVEYEGRPPSRWVPFPVSRMRFAELASEVGLTPPVTVGSRRSLFGGTMYAAYADRERPVEP